MPILWLFVVVQLLRFVQLFVTPWTAAHWASLSVTISGSLLKLLTIRVDDAIQLSYPLYRSIYIGLLLLPLLLPSIFPSIRVFSNESPLPIRWPEYWSFSFCINPSNEYSGLISFRVAWLDFLAVQGTLKSLHQHHNLEASILQWSAFFLVQLSHPYITTEEMITLIIWTFVSKAMSLLFNMLSSFSSKEQASFNFKVVVTVCSDFGTQGSKICHWFHSPHPHQFAVKWRDQMSWS